MKLALLVVVGMSLLGCTSRFDAPSAYAQANVLCGKPELETAISSCRDAWVRDGSCLGVIGFSGSLENESVRVQTTWVRVRIGEIATDAHETVFSGFRADGVSPYFYFQLEATEIGGSIDMPVDEPRRLWLTDARYDGEHYTDDRSTLALRLTAAGESKNLRAHSGSMVVRFPEAHSIRGEFDGDFGGEGHLDGCFAVFEPAEKKP